MARTEALFRRYRDRGDVRSLGKVFDRTADEVLRVAMYFARDPVQAEEWVQQTYLIAIERAESWDGSRLFLPWLLGILRNVVRREHAKRREAALPETPLTAPRTQDAVEDLEWTEAVAEAVENLPDPYRAVLILRLQHELAPAEIARLQRIPVATIRSQIHRGLVRLRAALPRDHRPAVLAALVAPGGLAAVRAEVLTVASSSASVTCGLATGMLGGLAMKNVIVAVAVVAVLALAVADPLGLWTEAKETEKRDTTSTPVEAEPETAKLKGRVKAEPGDASAVAAHDVDLEGVDRVRDLHGVVVLKSGEPVAGAEVVVVASPWRGLMINDPENAETVELASAATGRQGTFALRLSEGDRGSLRVTAAGHLPRQVWSVGAGEYVRVVVDDTVTLVVRVLAPDGTPAPRAAIRVSGAGDGLGPRRSARAATDARGTARIPGLDPAGSLMLWAVPQREGWGYSEYVRVNLPAEGSVEQTIRLPAGKTIRGEVSDAATGRPIPGARVGLGRRLDPFVHTDEQGAYAIHGWTPEGVHGVSAAAPGYARVWKGIERPEEDVDFSLTTGSRLVGRVVDESRAPVESAIVAVIGNTHGRGGQRLSLAHGRTNGQGFFALDGLASDLPLSINVRARGFARRIVDVDPIAGPEREVADIVLTPPLVLRGTVLRADGEPAARRTVRIVGPDIEQAMRFTVKRHAQYPYGTREDVTTDDLGRFTIPNLGAGTFVVTCEARAPLVAEEVTLETSGPETSITLRLPSTRTLRVRVLDPEGEPLTHGLVAASHEGRGIKSRLDAQGCARLEIPVQVKEIQVQPFDRNEYADPGEVPVPDDSDRIVVRLEDATLIRGVVLQPDGNPIGHGLVVAMGAGEKRFYAPVDAEGRFSLNCPEEVVDLTFSGHVFRNGQQSRVPFHGEAKGIRRGSADVRLLTSSMAGDATLGVRVVGPDGPLEGLMVFLEPSPGGPAVKRTDAEGAVVFENLASIERKVRAFGKAADGSSWPDTQVRVARGDTEITITMQRPAMLRGVVVDSEGKPADGVMVKVEAPDEENRTLVGGMTPEDGTFEFPVPTSTRLNVIAQAMIDREVFEAELALDEPPTEEIQLRLKLKAP